MRRWMLACAGAVLALACTGMAAPAAMADTGHRTATTKDATTKDVTRADWSAGPVSRGTGYARSNGSRRVRELQRRLIRQGFRPGPVDGLYGPRTERAVRRFQARRGLQVDAVVGPRTLRALRRGTPEPTARRTPAVAPAPVPQALPGPASAPPRAPVAAPEPGDLPVTPLLVAFGVLGLAVLATSYRGTRRRVLQAQARAAPPPVIGRRREAAR